MVLSTKMGEVLPDDLSSWRGQQFVTEYADLHMIGHFEPIAADEVMELTPVAMQPNALPPLAQAGALITPFNPRLLSASTPRGAEVRLAAADLVADLPPQLQAARPPQEQQLVAKELKEKRVVFDASLETEVHFAYAMAVTEKAKKHLARLEQKINVSAKNRTKLQKEHKDTAVLRVREANYKAEKLQLSYEAAAYLGDIVIANTGRANQLLEPATNNLLAFMNSVIAQGKETITSWQHNPALHAAQKPALAGLYQKIDQLIQQAEVLHLTNRVTELRGLKQQLLSIREQLIGAEPPPKPAGIAYSPDQRYLVHEVEGQQYVCFCKENGEISPLTIRKGDVTSGVTTDNYVDFSNAVRQNDFPKRSTDPGAKMLETAEIILTTAGIDLDAIADHLTPKQKMILAFMVAEGGISPAKARAVIGRYTSVPTRFPKLVDRLYSRYRQQQASAQTLANKFPRSFVGTPERQAALAYEVSKHGATLANAVFKTKAFDSYYPDVDGALRPLYAKQTADSSGFVKFLSVIKAGSFTTLTTAGSVVATTAITALITGSMAVPVLNIIVLCALVIAGVCLLGVGLYYLIRHLKRRYL